MFPGDSSEFRRGGGDAAGVLMWITGEPVQLSNDASASCKSRSAEVSCFLSSMKAGLFCVCFLFVFYAARRHVELISVSDHASSIRRCVEDEKKKRNKQKR